MYSMDDDNPDSTGKLCIASKGLKLNRAGRGISIVEDMRKPAKIPPICIEHCANCHDDRATSRCNKCEVVYYCSEECKEFHYATHKATCKKFQSDVEYLASASSAFISFLHEVHRRSANNALNGWSTRDERRADVAKLKEYSEDAMRLYVTTLIRVRQDKACTSDTTIAESEILKDHPLLLENVITYSITDADLDYFYMQGLNTSLERVRRLTLKNRLVSPFRIKRYSKMQPIDIETVADEFLPQEEWLPTRLQALDAAGASLKNKSIRQSIDG